MATYPVLRFADVDRAAMNKPLLRSARNALLIMVVVYGIVWLVVR